MNYHVFIVDSTTFKCHLEYMFAGTGAKDKMSGFLSDPSDTNTHFSTERNLVGMIADISRVRAGDKIIFYLQNKGFFGVFRARTKAFFDENDTGNYLKDELKKGLSYRVEIEPDEVYQEGVSENEYLDSLQGKHAPYEMCWSLIYRKLKGNRGCTMITEYEYMDLLSKLKAKNNAPLISSAFTYENGVIQSFSEYSYKGRKHSLDIKARMLEKARRCKSFEGHLQAYLMQNFDKPDLKFMFYPIPESSDIWVGNEVSCGVGMQRIDIMTIQSNDTDVYIRIIELKDEEPAEYLLLNQLPRYIRWADEYVVPNYSGKNIHITPCIIAKNTNNMNFLSAADAFEFEVNNAVPEPLEYIGFNMDFGTDTISFNKVI